MVKENLAKILLDFLLESNAKDPIIKYFRRSTISYIIFLKILDFHLSSKKLSIDEMEKSTIDISSRKTLFSSLEDAVSRRYIIKEVDQTDQRKINLIPTKELIKSFETWSEDLVSKLNRN